MAMIWCERKNLRPQILAGLSVFSILGLTFLVYETNVQRRHYMRGVYYEKMKERKRQYEEENVDKIAERKRQIREANRERRKKYQAKNLD